MTRVPRRPKASCPITVILLFYCITDIGVVNNLVAKVAQGKENTQFSLSGHPDVNGATENMAWYTLLRRWESQQSL